MPMFEQGPGMPIDGQRAAPQGLGAPGGAQMPPGQAPPPGVPPGAAVQPGPSEMALANQVYQMQQLYLQMQRQITELMSRPVQMNVTLHRDNEGKVAGMTATEGSLK